MPADKSVPPPEDAAQEDELHQSFRAALDRKRKKRHPHEEHLDAHGSGPSHNDKTQRVFRRKSGG